MEVATLEGKAVRKRAIPKRKPITLTLDPESRERIELEARIWGLSISGFLERAGLWYAIEVRRNPIKMRIPDPDEDYQ